MRSRKSMIRVIDELNREMDRMLGEALRSSFEPMMQDVESKELKPLTSVVESEEGVLVIVDLPCVQKRDIKLEATPTKLKVEAPMRKCVKLNLWGNEPGELEFKSFRRTVELPVPVDPKRAAARFKEGILEVRFPKKVAGVKIQIR